MSGMGVVSMGMVGRMDMIAMVRHGFGRQGCDR